MRYLTRIPALAFILAALAAWSGASEIDDAIRRGEVDRVRELVDENPGLVKAALKRDGTLLHLAARCEWPKIVKLLLKRGADVNAKGPTWTGYTPLHSAVRGPTREKAEPKGCDVVGLLLEAGADPNARPEDRGLTPLHVALHHSRADMTRLLIAHGADVKAKLKDDVTPLHLAARSQRNAVLIETLIGRGAEVDATDAEGDTPLNWAAFLRNDAAADVLIRHGARLDVFTVAVFGNNEKLTALLDQEPNLVGATDRARRLTGGKPVPRGSWSHEGWTPLHCAAFGDKEETAALLLDRGADVNAAGASGGTPLHVAVRRGSTAMIEFLLDRGADLKAETKEGKKPIDHVMWGSERTIGIGVLLLKRGADLPGGDPDGRTPLHHVATTPCTEGAKLLLEKGADVNARESLCGGTPLHWAVGNRRARMAEVLIAAGADVNARDRDGRTPLTCALRYDDQEKVVVEALVKHGARFNVFTAAAHGRTEELAALLDARPRRLSARRLSASDSKGWTALHWAAFWKRPETAALLLDRGADPDTVTVASPSASGRTWGFELEGRVGDRDDRYTPLHLAAAGGHRKLAELLLGKGATLDARTEFDRTPLHIAAAGGRAEMVRLLIERGADIDARYVSRRMAPGRQLRGPGSTPLHLAVSGGHTVIVKLLLAGGADTKAKDGYGRTPIELVTYNVPSEIRDMLRGGDRK